MYRIPFKRHLILLASCILLIGVMVPLVTFAHSAAQNTQPWVALAPLPPAVTGATGRTEGACTAVIGDKIYVAFGFDPRIGDTNFLRIYDIPSNTWTIGPPVPTAGRSEMYRGVAHGGKLYCLGGRPTTETWSFDPATSTWTSLAPIPDLRVGTTAAVFGNSIFVFGGRKAFAPCSGPAIVPSSSFTTILRYDIDQNAWFNAGNLVISRSDATVARVGDRMYIFGGCDSRSFPDGVEVYDPATATATLLLVPLPGGPRADLASANPQDGSSASPGHSIQITGGWSTAGSVTPNHIIFDVNSQTFTVGVEMPRHCTPGVDRAEGETVYHGDSIYAVGGSCPDAGASLDNLDMQKLSG